MCIKVDRQLRPKGSVNSKYTHNSISRPALLLLRLLLRSSRFSFTSVFLIFSKCVPSVSIWRILIQVTFLCSVAFAPLACRVFGVALRKNPTTDDDVKDDEHDGAIFTIAIFNGKHTLSHASAIFI